MSLNTILMAETMPAEGILEGFHKLETEIQSTPARMTELVHYSYHRGYLPSALYASRSLYELR